MPTEKTAALVFEFGLVLTGWFLLWRLWLSPAARKKNGPAVSLRRWNLPLSAFAIASACVCFGWLLASALMGSLQSRFPALKSDEALSLIVGGSFSQGGILLGAITAWFYLRNTGSVTTAQPAGLANRSRYGLWSSALATVIITISVVHPVQWLWEQFLSYCELPVAKQEVVALFYRAQSPLRITALALVAVVLAPITEEIVFRGGLFRFLRERLPRAFAVGLPALLFALLHVNPATLDGLVTVAPLTAFGIVFSLAYERTGRLGVVILAHALFNLHTLLFLLLGLAD